MANRLSEIKHHCYYRWNRYDKISVAIIVGLLCLVGQLVWWEYFDTRVPIVYNNLPFEAGGDLHPGGTVFTVADQYKYTDKGFTSSSDLIPCGSRTPVFNWQDEGPGGGKGHRVGATPGKLIPSFIAPGSYFIESRITYRINPIKIRDAFAYTSCFEITEPPNDSEPPTR